MNRKLRHLALGIIVGVCILLILLLILPINVVYDIPVQSRAYPGKEWKLIQEGEQFRTELSNYSDNESAATRNFVFERGDVIDISFSEQILNNSMIAKDEKLLQFQSMMHNLRIQRALNEIQLQESMKVAGAAAMKRPLYDEAEDAIELARSNVKLQQANHERLSQLLDAGVISQAELDQQTNRLEVATQELSIAERRLRNTSFEAKPEDLAIFSTRIETMDRELDVLLAQQSAYMVNVPFEGRVKLQPAEGVIVSLQDTTSQALIFPFPIADRELLSTQSYLSIETSSGTLNVPFTLKDEVGVIRGKQQCLGVARLSNPEFSLGEIVSAEVVCDTVKLRDYIYRKLL